MEQDIWILHEQTGERHIGMVIFYMYDVQIKWRETVVWVQMHDLGWEPIYSIPHSHVDVSVVGHFEGVVLFIYEIFWKAAQFEVHVLVMVYGGVEIEDPWYRWS